MPTFAASNDSLALTGVSVTINKSSFHLTHAVMFVIITACYSLLSTNFIHDAVLLSDLVWSPRISRDYVWACLSVAVRVALSRLFSRLCFRAPLSLVLCIALREDVSQRARSRQSCFALVRPPESVLRSANKSYVGQPPRFGIGY